MPSPWTAYEQRILRNLSQCKPPYTNDVRALINKRRRFARHYAPIVRENHSLKWENRRLKAELEKLRGSTR